MTGDFQKTASTWGTMLVGGLGAGGKGFYALDITNQKNFASMTESALSAIPMWEFTAAQDADLGYTFNEPSIHPVSGTYQQIAKVVDASDANGVWRVIVGNGFGATTGDAVLFMLNANTGAAALKLQAAGLIRYARGHISVLDREGLEHRTCECYRVVKKEYDRLLPDLEAA